MKKEDYINAYNKLEKEAINIIHYKNENKEFNDNILNYDNFMGYFKFNNIHIKNEIIYKNKKKVNLDLIMFPSILRHLILLSKTEEEKEKNIEKTRVYKYLFEMNKKYNSILLLKEVRRYFEIKFKNTSKVESFITKKEIYNFLNQIFLYQLYFKNYKINKKEYVYLKNNIKNIEFNINYKNNNKYYNSLFKFLFNKKEFFIENIKFSNLNIENKNEENFTMAIIGMNKKYKNLKKIEFEKNNIEGNIFIKGIDLIDFKSNSNNYKGNIKIYDSKINDLYINENEVQSGNYEINLNEYNNNLYFEIKKINNTNLIIKNKIKEKTLKEKIKLRIKNLNNKVKKEECKILNNKINKMQKLELIFLESENVNIDLSKSNLSKNITIKAKKGNCKFNKIDISKSIIKDGIEGCVSISNIIAEELSFESTNLNSSLRVEYVNINKLSLKNTKIKEDGKYLRIENSKIKSADFERFENKYNIKLYRNIFEDLKLDRASFGYFKENNEFEQLEVGINENCKFEIKECEITKLLTLNNMIFYGEIFEIKNNTEIKRIEMKNFNLLNKNNILLEDNNINNINMKINNIENMIGLSFKGSIFKGGFNIENKNFHCVPDLTNIKYENEISLHAFKVKITNNLKDKDRLRKLKEISEKNQDIEQTLYFNGKELETNKKIYCIVKLYKKISNYGYSIGKPFFCWIMNNIIFSFIYYVFLFWNSANKSFYPSDIINYCNTLKFSFLNSVSFGQILRNPNKMFFEHFYNKPEGTFNIVVDMPWHHMIAIKFHILLSAIFIFLMLLGIRNRFRIK